MKRFNCERNDWLLQRIRKYHGYIYTGAISAINSEPGSLRISVVIPLHCSLHAFKMAKIHFIKLRQFHIQYMEIESFSTKVFVFNYCNDENALMILSSNLMKCEFHLHRVLCMYVCMYVRTYIRTYVCMYVWFVCMYGICMYGMYIHVCIHSYTCTYLCA